MDVISCPGYFIISELKKLALNWKRYEFESRSGKVYSIQHYVIKFVSDLR